MTVEPICPSHPHMTIAKLMGLVVIVGFSCAFPWLIVIDLWIGLPLVLIWASRRVLRREPTLIELLVVIALLGVALGLILPDGSPHKGRPIRPKIVPTASTSGGTGQGESEDAHDDRADP
jgi:hypothetical protein